MERVSASANSDAVAGRSAGSGASARWHSARSSGPPGVDSGNAGISASRRRWTIVASPRPGHIRRCASASHNITPTAKMSVRRSTASPRACSGAA